MVMIPLWRTSISWPISNAMAVAWVRMNLEELFHKYEVNVEIYTTGLLKKLESRDADIKGEIIDLFAAMLRNFIRNPFCIEKVLNSFPSVASYEPTDPELLAQYRKLSRAASRTKRMSVLPRSSAISENSGASWVHPTIGSRPRRLPPGSGDARRGRTAVR
jgi:hypothetical protein